mmetsp:Transcript_17653/g.45189  ORF Transcript_17653/g.45189 Transcript_17653/m.45189 type:complete len:372 (-) Transcript_17653:609-1724(-)
MRWRHAQTFYVSLQACLEASRQGVWAWMSLLPWLGFAGDGQSMGSPISMPRRCVCGASSEEAHPPLDLATKAALLLLVLAGAEVGRVCALERFLLVGLVAVIRKARLEGLALRLRHHNLHHRVAARFAVGSALGRARRAHHQRLAQLFRERRHPGRRGADARHCGGQVAPRRLCLLLGGAGRARHHAPRSLVHGRCRRREELLQVTEVDRLVELLLLLRLLVVRGAELLLQPRHFALQARHRLVTLPQLAHRSSRIGRHLAQLLLLGLLDLLQLLHLRLEVGHLHLGLLHLAHIALDVPLGRAHLDTAHARREVEAACRLTNVGHVWRNVHDHHRLRVAAQGVGQQSCQLAVAVRNVRALGGEGVDAVAER